MADDKSKFGEPSESTPASGNGGESRRAAEHEPEPDDDTIIIDCGDYTISRSGGIFEEKTGLNPFTRIRQLAEEVRQLKETRPRPKPRGRRGRPANHPRDKRSRLTVLFKEMLNDKAVLRNMQPGQVAAAADKDERYQKSYREIAPSDTVIRTAWANATGR